MAVLGRARRSLFRWPVAVLAAAVLFLAFGDAADAAGKYDAADAARVDGKQAVSAAARVSVRAGNLVATSKTTGRLPNNIIAEAPNSARLSGYGLRQLEAFSLPVQAAFVQGGAHVTDEGVVLPAGEDTEMVLSFIVPPAHVEDEPLYANIVYEEDTDATCTWAVHTAGLNGPGQDNDITDGGWTSAGWRGRQDGIIYRPNSAGDGFRLTFKWPSFQHPGDFVQFDITREGTDSSDTCGDITIDGLQIRY